MDDHAKNGSIELKQRDVAGNRKDRNDIAI
jgi:hypothetical protein